MAGYKPRVVTFRAEEDAAETTALFRKYEFEGINLPLIVITPVLDNTTIEIVDDPGSFDIIIFTSVHAFYALISIFDGRGDIDVLFGKEIACVGEKTAQKVMELFSAENIVIPEKFSAEGLVDYYKTRDIHGEESLLPLGNLAGKTLSEELTGMGAEVKRVVVYKNEAPPEEENNLIRTVLFTYLPEFLIFTSPSIFKNFLKATGEDAGIILENSKICAIGDVTKKEIELNGFKVDVMPDDYTMEALMQKLKNINLRDEN
ncbi:MAG: uroporphyrinogen-III synthase [Ignavibacteriales bacterium]|nr:uroporphyrinogen-III synthase [Ignavibacteriales bacterium]